MISLFSKLILKAFGWRVELSIPVPDKCVLIGAPHTSNWDFPLTMLTLTAMKIRFNWVAKHTLFRWPLGVFFKAIGGIPVDRGSGTGFLKNTIQLFRGMDKFILAIAPEGTRSRTRYWKTGFYTIAEKAGVPIVLGFVDYDRKCAGIGFQFEPSGNIEQDFELIRDFYADKRGRFPENQGEICFKPPKAIKKDRH